MTSESSDSEIVENKSSGIFSLPGALLKKLYTNSDEARLENISQNESSEFEDIQKETELTEASKALLSLINNAQKLFQNDESFSNVKKMAYEVVDEESANRVIFAFISTLKKSSKQFCIERKEEIFQLPLDILNNFKFSGKYKEQSKSLKNKCKNIGSFSEVNECFEAAYGLFYTIYQDTNSDKEELEKFLFNIGSRISHISDKLHDVAEEQESDIKIQGDLNVRMNNAVKLISNNIVTGNDLDSLKNTVKEQLDSLQNIVEEEREIVKAQEFRIQNNVKALANRVHELQKEAQELRVKVQHEKEQALKDILTGINNRQAYNEKVSDLIDSDGAVSACLLIWDIDHFKKFNDQYGHVVGDKVLKTVAEKMNSSLEHDYFLARYGGEEFAMLLPGLSVDEAMQFANTVREDVSNIVFLVKGQQVKVTVSCGITSYQQEDNEQTLFERADKALYVAKQDGRNRVAISE